MSDSPIDRAADAWLASMQARRRKGRNGYRPMPPWDEQAYFDIPVQSTFTANGVSWIQVASANMRRVAIMFGNPNTAIGGAAIINWDGSQPTTNGFQVSATTAPVLFIQSDHGPLPALDWFFFGPNGTVLTVGEVILREWPGDTGIIGE